MLTAARTAALAEELGIPEVLAVGNKATTPEDEQFLRDALAAEGIPLTAVLPYDRAVADQDRAGAGGPTEVGPDVRRTLGVIVAALDDAASRLKGAGA